MLTTALPFLQSVSYELGETTTNTEAVRLNYFNRSVEEFFAKHPFKFRIKKYTLTLDGSGEYDLTSKISDYDTSHGIYLVENGDGKIFEPIDYSERKYFDNPDVHNFSYKYYLTPNRKDIGFPVNTSGEVCYIHYYAVHTNVSDASTSLNVSIPEYCLRPITTLILYRIYQRKRQRYDARNMLLDFKEQLEDAIFNDSKSNKVGFLPKAIPSVRRLLGF